MTQKRFSCAPWLVPTLVLLALSLAACTTITEKARGWLASDADAYAVMDGRVLIGNALFFSERDARVQVQSSDEPSLSCFGPLRFNATTSGVVEFNCSNGRTATVYFQAMGPLSGAGRGVLDDLPPGAVVATNLANSTPSKAEFVLTYGLTPAKAVGYLAVSADRLMPPKPVASASAAKTSE